MAMFAHASCQRQVLVPDWLADYPTSYLWHVATYSNMHGNDGRLLGGGVHYRGVTVWVRQVIQSGTGGKGASCRLLHIIQ